MDYIQMEGRRILVAGGSSGIGKETAILLSKLGSKVAVIARREDKLKETLSQMSGDGHSIHVVDLYEVGELEEKIKEIVAQTGKFDGYVHASGITRPMPLKNFTTERLDRIMRVNFYSYFEMVRVLSNKKYSNLGMSIVGISSIEAVIGVKANSAYAASKAAMDGAMRCFARELAAKDIRVNSILPGATETAMMADWMLQAESSGANAINPRQYLGMNSPLDVANAVVFLLSPISSKITGVQLPVDGGYTST